MCVIAGQVCFSPFNEVQVGNNSRPSWNTMEGMKKHAKGMDIGLLESKECIKEVLCMRPQISFLMRGAFMPINLVYPRKRVLFLYFSTPNNPLLYFLTSTLVFFNSPNEQGFIKKMISVKIVHLAAATYCLLELYN